MDVGSISAASLESVSNQAAVKVFKGASEQVEAVMGILIGGIQAAGNSLPSHKGQNLNLAA